MAQQYKKDSVANLKERLDGAKSIVLVDYKGINIAEVDELRNRLREAHVDYFISKNTFIKIALHDLGIETFDSHLVGPTAVAVSKEDEVAPARVIAKFIDDVMDKKEFPRFKCGLVDSTPMSDKELIELAKLPSREELLARMLAGFNSPITGFVGALSGIIRKFVYAVDAIAKQQEQNK
ncbi:MAG: 50S ribosomal protein L10 [Candidatus Cloacimonetes bacterium]|nr:50S ribosomal protein L10 [Candidatus Cloacimonadota bacterium]